MNRMTNRTALVVGGATGIGLAIAQRLAAEGAAVTLTGRDAAKVEAAAAAVGRGARGLVADAGAPDAVARAVAAAAGDGSLDALVLNAGISEEVMVRDETPDTVDRHFAVNVRGPVLALGAALGRMGRGGAVVLVGSIADVAGIPGRGTYAATKAALRSYARTWAAELAPDGIRVNVVSPGPTDTAMMAAASDALRQAIVGMVPLGRMGRPDEVAAAAAFLLSDDASYVTGAELCVDGGMRQV